MSRRAGRRAYRRQAAILGELHEYGSQSGRELCIRLGLSSSAVYRSLGALERQSLVVHEWECYRIASADEREQGRRISRQVEQEIAERVAARRGRLKGA